MFVNKMEREAVASLRPVGGWSEATQAGPRGAHETSECKKLAEAGWIILTAHSFLASLAEIQAGLEPGPWGQTEFQFQLELGLTPRVPPASARVLTW